MRTVTELPAHGEGDALAAFQRTRAPEDFGVLVDLTYDRVLAVADRILLNESDSRDAAQESFVTAYHRFASFRGASSFATWVCGIAVRKAIALARRRRPTVPVDEAADCPSRPADAPDRQAMQSEEMGLLAAAMDALAPELRAALALTVVDQLSGAEAARVCGCTRVALYWRVHRARAQLKRSLRGMGDDHERS
jgi:RNA polymerase sigma-70 factor (ECF subfamily)